MPFCAVLRQKCDSSSRFSSQNPRANQAFFTSFCTWPAPEKPCEQAFLGVSAGPDPGHRLRATPFCGARCVWDGPARCGCPDCDLPRCAHRRYLLQRMDIKGPPNTVYSLYALCRNPHCPHSYPQNWGTKCLFYRDFRVFSTADGICIKFVHRLRSLFVIFLPDSGFNCDIFPLSSSISRHIYPLITVGIPLIFRFYPFITPLFQLIIA